MKHKKAFKEAHPETIGETDKEFDRANYTEWLESELEAVKAELKISERLKSGYFTSFSESLDALEAVKAELEMSKYTGQSAVNELSRYKQETDEIVKGLKAELEKIQKHFTAKDLELQTVKAELQGLKLERDRWQYLYEKEKAERDELKAFVAYIANFSFDPHQKDAYDWIDKAQQLLNTPE